MNNVFIVLRGPSGAGKSTVAKILKKELPSETVIIEQDYFNHQLLEGMRDTHKIIPQAIESVAKIALNAGYNVILEGILRTGKYDQMIDNITQQIPERSFVFYFDISPEETVRRHTTREKANAFNNEEMLTWYDLASPLGVKNEVIIGEELSKDEIVNKIINEVVRER